MHNLYPLLEYVLDVISDEDLAIMSPNNVWAEEPWYKGAISGHTWTFMLVADIINSYPDALA